MSSDPRTSTLWQDIAPTLPSPSLLLTATKPRFSAEAGIAAFSCVSSSPTHAHSLTSRSLAAMGSQYWHRHTGLHRPRLSNLHHRLPPHLLPLRRPLLFRRRRNDRLDARRWSQRRPSPLPGHLPVLLHWRSSSPRLPLHRSSDSRHQRWCGQRSGRRWRSRRGRRR